MSQDRQTLYYYINEEAKEVIHYTEQLTQTPENYVFCGMSQLPVRGAAGYYTKNQSGYTIVNGDKRVQETQEDDKIYSQEEAIQSK